MELVIFQIPKRFMEKADIWFVLKDVIDSTCVKSLSISELEKTLIMN